jgi:hypothetical protein
MLSFYFQSLQCILSQILLFQPLVIICKLQQVPVCYGLLANLFSSAYLGTAFLKPHFFFSFFFFRLDTAY